MVVLCVVWMGEGGCGGTVEGEGGRVERGRMVRIGVEPEFIPSKLWAAPS